MSDAGWRGIPGACWKFADWRQSEGGQAVRCLHFDAQAEPQNWRLPGFDDGKTGPPAFQSPTRWPQLVNSEIPPRLEAVYPIQAIIAPDGKRPDSGPSNHLSPAMAAAPFAMTGF